MRIDNPKPKDIKAGDTVHFKPQVAIKSDATDDSVEVGDGWWYPLKEVAYIEREDTLEVGDEISWTIIAEFTAKVIAIAAGHVMYQWHDGQVNMEPLSYFQHHSFKITKKAGAQ